jgi:chromosomal replication initiation ATPase DnaA
MKPESCIFPPLPSQPIKSLDERLAEADAFCGELSPKIIQAIKSKIRGSARDFEEIPEAIKPIWGLKKIQEIQREVGLHFDVSMVAIISRRHSKNVVLARHIAMYLSKELTARSFPDIGRMFGNRDHTTVLHAVRKIMRLLEDDSALAEEIAALKEKCCHE